MQKSAYIVKQWWLGLGNKTTGIWLEKLGMSVKVLSHPGHGIQVQVESKAPGLSVGS